MFATSTKLVETVARGNSHYTINHSIRYNSTNICWQPRKKIIFKQNFKQVKDDIFDYCSFQSVCIICPSSLNMEDWHLHDGPAGQR